MGQPDLPSSERALGQPSFQSLKASVCFQGGCFPFLLGKQWAEQGQGYWHLSRPLGESLRCSGCLVLSCSLFNCGPTFRLFSEWGGDAFQFTLL